MTLSWTMKTKWLAGAMLALVSAIPVVSAARTTTALLMFANPADAGCFDHTSSGRIVNRCTTQRTVFFPVVIDRAGPLTVNVGARSDNTSNNVCCFAQGTAWDGSPWVRSGSRCLPSFGASTTITVTGASLPDRGSAFVQCDVGPGAIISSVNYNH